MAIDENDIIYVATGEISNRSVYAINATDGSFKLIYAFSNDGLGNYYTDQGLCYFGGSLFLPRMSQITKIDLRNGNQITRFSGTGIAGNTPLDGGKDSATFFTAIKCTTDSVGNIYVAENAYDILNSSYIRKVDTSGSVTTFAITNFRSLSLEIDINGKLIVADTDNGRVREMYNNGSATIIATTKGPTAVVPDLLGNIFVSDSTDNCVYWLDVEKYRRNLVGDSTGSGFADGSGSTARFDGFGMMVFDSKGRLFLVDQNNEAVRMVTW